METEGSGKRIETKYNIMIDAMVSNDRIHNMMKEYSVWRNIGARKK